LIAEIASNKAWTHVLKRLQRHPSLSRHLQAFALAAANIGAGRGVGALNAIQSAQDEMQKCKSAVPCWIMPLYKVAEAIRPEQGIYDYVIIDEASQLGPDAIFLLYLAKNIIIVGDDKQTSPEYIGVNQNTMTPQINRHLQGIPFANFYNVKFSFFDHAKMFCNGKTVLREHFRCMPEIIEFCNQNFYADSGMGLYPLKQYSQDRLAPLINIFCQNGNTDGTNAAIINKPEAQRLVDEIAKLVKDERYDGKTLGIITLQGTGQAEVIESLLLKVISESEFKDRKLVCGNSTSFQGDERDIIFLSLVTAHNHNRRALEGEAYKRRFNVAVSRAKEQIWLFHSVQLQDLMNTNDLRYKLLNHFINYKPDVPSLDRRIPTPKKPRHLGEQPVPFDSWFEVDVFNDLIVKRYAAIPQYEVVKGRYRIDLAVILPNGTKIAIECDGDKWHGAQQYQNDMMRQRDLERYGWQFFRVRGSSYYTNREKALEPLWDMLPDLTSPPSVTTPTENPISDIPDAPAPAPIVTPEKVVIDDGQQDLFSITDINEVQAAPATRHVAPASNLKEFLIFTNQFNVYKLKNTGYNRTTAYERVKADFNDGEKKICRTLEVNMDSGFLIIAFENGKIAKVNISCYATQKNRRLLTNAYSNVSKLVSIHYFDDETDLVAISTSNKVLLFNTANINAKSTKTTHGKNVMRLNGATTLKAIKELSKVNLTNPEHYRYNIPAVGNNLSKGDKL